MQKILVWTPTLKNKQKSKEGWLSKLRYNRINKLRGAGVLAVLPELWVQFPEPTWQRNCLLLQFQGLMPPPLKFYLFLFCVTDTLPACICMQCPQRAEEGFRPL